MKSQKGGIQMFIVLILILGSLAFIGGFSTPKQNLSANPNTSTFSLQNYSAPPGSDNSSSRNSLQIQALSFVTGAPTLPPQVTPQPSPTPYDSCHHDSCQPVEPGCDCAALTIECDQGKCVKVIDPVWDPTGSCDYYPNWPNPRQVFDLYCSYCRNSSGTFCIGKPVIYLYPTKTTTVNVTLDIPGVVYESIPAYVNGWKNIEAHPDGSLIYQGKTYSELYYESAVSNVTAPSQGFVVQKSKLEQKLKDLTARLGLIEPEQKEFLDYWLPKVNNLNSPYVFISILSKEEKERIDKVNISPQPDTKIEFLVYFKPLSSPVQIQPLNLPQTPERIGFTSVEWGGTIDNENN